MAIYTATFAAIGVAAAQDLFEIVAPSNSRVKINSIEIGQYTDFGDAAAEILSMQLIRGFTTTGSGGAAVTPANISGITGSPSAGSTVARNNTTVAQDGTGLILLANSWNIQAPWVYQPRRDVDPTRDERIILAPSQRLVLRVTAPADSLTTNGTLIFEEVGQMP